MRWLWAEATTKNWGKAHCAQPHGNWSSFQLANSTPPLSVNDGALAPFARMKTTGLHETDKK